MKSGQVKGKKRPRDQSLQKARMTKGLDKDSTKQTAALDEIRLADQSRQQEDHAGTAQKGQALPKEKNAQEFHIGVQTRSMSRAESRRGETTGERVPLHQQDVKIRHGTGGDPQGDEPHHADDAAGRDEGK